MFEKLTNYVTDDAQRTQFARALIDKLVNFSFEEAFSKSYDFFAAIFEYVIKDYNTNGGGVYAEYYTPHAIAVIMVRLLVGDEKDLHNIECYDPAAGTGTLLMALGHQIGEDKCTIFAQYRSQKSNKMLKLNLILNGLVYSLDHAVQGDTLTDPYHKSDDGGIFKTKNVAQNILSSDLNTQISVNNAANEGGAWGIALLASYMSKSAEMPLEEYLDNIVFKNSLFSEINVLPDSEISEGFNCFMNTYDKYLNAEYAITK